PRLFSGMTISWAWASAPEALPRTMPPARRRAVVERVSRRMVDMDSPQGVVTGKLRLIISVLFATRRVYVCPETSGSGTALRRPHAPAPHPWRVTGPSGGRREETLDEHWSLG